jgi:hypothetical protein
MQPLKLAIIEEVKKSKRKFSDRDVATLNAEFFLQENTLRLSYYGYINIKDVFTPYPFELDYTIRPKHLIGLAKVMKYPYYLSRMKLVLFSDSDAIMISLYGDVRIFLENGLEYTK